MNQQPTTAAARDRIAPGAATLWACAFILFALILTQASRLGGPATAGAELVSHVGDLVTLTANAGNNEDILLVLDGRSDRILIYGVEQGDQLVFRSSYETAELFQTGRAASGRRSR